VEADISYVLNKDNMNGFLEEVVGERLSLRSFEVNNDEIFFEAVIGNGRAYMYFSMERGRPKGRSLIFKDLLIFFPDPLEATIFSGFIPSFSRDVEMFFYGDWTIFCIGYPSYFDIKLAISAVKISSSGS